MATIPWDSPAHFTDIDGDDSLNGTLSECVRAYQKLPDANKRGALITTDELVDIPDQPAPMSNLDHEALDWLAAQISVDGQ